MKRSLLGIAVGTGIAVTGFWLALLVIRSNITIGLFIIGLSVVLSMVAVAGFGGVTEPLTVGIRAAIAGLVAGSILFLLSAVTGSATITLLLPAVTLGVGGVIAHPGDRDPQRVSMRLAASGAAAVLVVAGGLVAVEVWMMLAPLLPLPALAAGDWLVDRSKD